MITSIVIVFLIGYFLIATESITRINKAAFALMMCAACWVLYALGGFAGEQLGEVIQRNLGEAGTTLFFLMGAMTIVEIVDQHGGFNFVREVMMTKSKRALLWRMSLMTFFLSAVLDNLTTTIVMIMILRKLVKEHQDRIIYASMIVIAANSGGAFSPIGDVTTIMLWNSKMITALGVMEEIFIPSLVSMVVPALVLQTSLKGELSAPDISTPAVQDPNIITSKKHRRTVFILGVGGLCSVPVFHSLTGLPPFVGILLVLAILWIVTDSFYRHAEKTKKRVVNLLSRIDMSTILFFLGILMAVSVLAEVGVLHSVGSWLDQNVGNHYLVTGSIGVLSSIVDNVPLVAGAMKMYPIMPVGDMAQDGIFWQLLAYCAGVGGSMLIIGSAAGVVAMGLEKITFGWYMKKITWIAFTGYIAGIGCYWIIRTFIF
ncbi:MAG: sodium:proton antiporter NhaD [Prevotellaceae bacterium]|nr:sodium:proton antiporter NhaD [Prevotellaceae bacterium]MDY3856673.1 sodium:proton antiporter NhaD [Bacteroidaceae bacterium]